MGRRRSVRRNLSRNNKRKSLSGGKKVLKEWPQLDAIVKYGISGMTAMYVANILVSVGAVGSVVKSLSAATGISSTKLMKAAGATTVAAVAKKVYDAMEDK